MIKLLQLCQDKLGEKDIDPNWVAGVPFCTQNCARFDGKRCEVLGTQPSQICAPTVRQMHDLMMDF